MSRERSPRQRPKEWIITAVHPEGAFLFIDGRLAKVGDAVLKGQNVTISVRETTDNPRINPLAELVLKQR